MKRFRILSPTGSRWLFLLLLLGIVVYAQAGIAIALPVFLASFLLGSYFYDPDRQLPSRPLGVMAPVDGRVIAIDDIHDPFVDRPCRRIRIEAYILRPYQSRSPTEGKMMEYWPQLPAHVSKYDETPVKGVWWVRTDEGDDVVMVVLSQFSIGPAYCRIQAGERIGQGRRCGRFPVLCHVDILMKDNVYIETGVGSEVTAGVTSLAAFNHEAVAAGQKPHRSGTYSHEG